MTEKDVPGPVRRIDLLFDSLLEIAAYLALAGFCFGVTWLFWGGTAIEPYVWLALMVCCISCLVPSLWQLGLRCLGQSDLSVALSMGFRVSILLGAVGLAAATKWQHNNSFCNSLLGYYFPFLILQSALLIRTQSFPHPPQS